MNCEKCDKVKNELYKKSKYNQNKLIEWLCLKCYEKVHKEDFDVKQDTSEDS